MIGERGPSPGEMPSAGDVPVAVIHDRHHPQRSAAQEQVQSVPHRTFRRSARIVVPTGRRRWHPRRPSYPRLPQPRSPISPSTRLAPILMTPATRGLALFGAAREPELEELPVTVVAEEEMREVIEA